MKTAKMVHELRRMSAQFICPPDTFFRGVADRLELYQDIKRERDDARYIARWLYQRVILEAAPEHVINDDTCRWLSEEVTDD